eukprot:jgi/Galph1/5776/GphlegSOOS_G4454.1
MIQRLRTLQFHNKFKASNQTEKLTAFYKPSSSPSFIRPTIQPLALESISKSDRIKQLDDLEYAMMMRTRKKTLLPVVADLFGNTPTAQTDKDSIFFISQETVAEILQGSHFCHLRILILDCRFPYEYEGGHIQGAHHCHLPQELIRMLCFTGWESNPLADGIIFYCEYSSQRAPKMCQHLRKWDRTVHADCYPTLSYPHLYIMSKGYREFHEKFPQLCVPPGGYTPMRYDNRQILRKYSAEHKYAWSIIEKQRQENSSLMMSALLSPRTQM